MGNKKSSLPGLKWCLFKTFSSKNFVCSVTYCITNVVLYVTVSNNVAVHRCKTVFHSFISQAT